MLYPSLNLKQLGILSRANRNHRINTLENVLTLCKGAVFV